METFPRMSELLSGREPGGACDGDARTARVFSEAMGDGWAVAGDAGYHKHPLTAQGITDAFRDADLLSEAIDQGFSGRRELDDSLEEYQGKRDAAVMPMYESTCERARLQPFPPEGLALFRTLRHNQHDVDRFSARMPARFRWRNSSRQTIWRRSCSRVPGHPLRLRSAR